MAITSYLEVQYPDLTELTHFYHNDYLEDLFSSTTTEFLFFLEALPAKLYTPLDYGFKPISSMNNWWPTHKGENREMKLWWMKMPRPFPKPRPVDRVRWGEYFNYSEIRFTRNVLHMAASGCGFKIGEPPFKARLFHRFFTLMRMPVETNRVQKRWLKLHNYRFVDKGELASYWVNGWPCETYSIDKEYKYFNTDQAEWKKRGEMEDY